MYLLLDIGGTFIKAAAWSPRHPKDLLHLTKVESHGGMQCDPGLFVAAVRGLIDPFLQVFQFKGCVSSTQLYSLVCVNDRAEALSPFISWQDTSFPALPAGSSAVSIGDYVIAALCELARTPAISSSVSHALKRRLEGWDQARVNVPQTTNMRVVGELRGGIPCYTPIGDSQLALYGAMLDDDEVAVNIGTGGQVSTLRKPKHPDVGVAIPYFDGVPLYTITHLPAGRTLTGTIGRWYEDPEAEPTRRMFYMMAEIYAKAIHDLSGERTPSLVFCGGVCKRHRALVEAIATQAGITDYRFSHWGEDSLGGLARIAEELDDT